MAPTVARLTFPAVGDGYLANVRLAIKTGQPDRAFQWARWLIGKTRETPEGRKWWRDWRRETATVPILTPPR